MALDPIKYRTRFLILTLLAVKPSHGYELSKRIEQLTKGLVRGSSGSIYPVLRELREQGLVEEDSVVEQGRLRKVYKLTRKGALALLEEINLFYGITNQILQLVAQARSSLERLVEGAEESCPPPHVLEALRRLRDAIDQYIEIVEEKARLCKGEGSS